MLTKVFPLDSFFYVSGHTIRYSGETLQAQGKYELVRTVILKEKLLHFMSLSVSPLSDCCRIMMGLGLLILLQLDGVIVTAHN